MDFDTLDVLYRSRQTILEILKDKGYVTAPYEKFGPFEIEKMASKDKSLNMEVRKDVADDFVGLSICRVEYAIPRVKNRIATFLSKLLKEDEEVAEEDAIDTSKTASLSDLNLVTADLTSYQQNPFGTVVFPIGSSLVQPGVVPAQPTTITFTSWSDLAESAGISRQYGGIHAISAHTGSLAIMAGLYPMIQAYWGL